MKKILFFLALLILYLISTNSFAGHWYSHYCASYYVCSPYINNCAADGESGPAQNVYKTDPQTLYSTEKFYFYQANTNYPITCLYSADPSGLGGPQLWAETGQPYTTPRTKSVENKWVQNGVNMTCNSLNPIDCPFLAYK